MEPKTASIHKRKGEGGMPDRSATACGKNLLTKRTSRRWIDVTCSPCLRTKA